MKHTLFALVLVLISGSKAFSQAMVDMDALCGEEAGGAVSSTASDDHPSLKLHAFGAHDLILVDRGFCKTYLESKTVLAQPTPGPVSSSQPSIGGWKVRLYMSHSFTTYFNSNVSFHSSRYNVEIKDYEWAERGSRDFFKPSNWFKDGTNPAQMIDEPTNTFTVSIEKDGNEFYLSVFHPKFFQQPGQIKQMTGTIDGVPVNGMQAIDPQARPDSPQPGESPLIRNEFTYAQMLYEVGYGHRFTVLQSKIGNITYIPHVGVGVMFGANHSVMTRPGAWYDYDEQRQHIGLNGYGVSVGNRIEMNFGKKEKFGVFYENRIGVYNMESKFTDGTEKFRLGFMGNSIGMKFVLFHTKPKKTGFN